MDIVMQRDTNENIPSEPINVIDQKKQRYCTCLKPYDPKQFYLQCDHCDQWYHGSCVNITESIAEQIEKWYCPDCAPSHKLIWKAKCARSDCYDRGRKSLYCSRECGIYIGSERLDMFKNEIITVKRNRTYRQELLSELALIVKERELYKIRIRNLEKRQLFIDDCIERIEAHRQNQDTRICGYDDRILEFGLSDFSESMPMEEEGTVCPYEGRCPMHDGWESIKSREIELELREQIDFYKKTKYNEIQILLKLSNAEQVESLHRLLIKH
jgi:hypothetical protein